jgi:hypothetical protein
MRGVPRIIAKVFANCVSPTPASPSSKTGLPKSNALFVVREIALSAMWPFSLKRSRISGYVFKRMLEVQ